MVWGRGDSSIDEGKGKRRRGGKDMVHGAGGVTAFSGYSMPNRATGRLAAIDDGVWFSGAAPRRGAFILVCVQNGSALLPCPKGLQVYVRAQFS